MRKILTLFIFLLTLFSRPTTTLAFSRDEWLQNARIRSTTTTVTNIVTNLIHLGGSQIVGNSASTTNSYQTLQEAINRINQLRTSLRLR